MVEDLRWSEWFITSGAAGGASLLGDEEIGEDHEEDADDEADVEVVLHPGLHAFPGRPAGFTKLAASFCCCRSCSQSLPLSVSS